MFPDEAPSAPPDLKSTAEMFAELRTKPKLREKFSFRLASSAGTAFSGETASDAVGFGFSVLWNSFHPEHASVSFHSYTIDNLESRSPMNYHVKERIHYGGSIVAFARPPSSGTRQSAPLWQTLT